MVDAKKKDKDTAFILHKAKEAQVDITYMKREEIDALATGKTHGGIIAYCGQRKYQNLEELVNKKQVFLALVEGVEDPFNFGYVLRTLYAAGCDGCLLYTSICNQRTIRKINCPGCTRGQAAYRYRK